MLSVTTGVPAEQVKFDRPLEIRALPPQMYPAPQAHGLYLDGDESDPLGYTSLTFFPGDDTPCASAVQEFPFPGNGAKLELADDDSQQLFFGKDFLFPFFGVDYSSVHVGSNGYLTFDHTETSTYSPSAMSENLQPAIAALYMDLDPSSTTVGSVTYEQLSDVYVVTFHDIPQFGAPNPDTEGKSFQYALHADGWVTITYLEIVHGTPFTVDNIGLWSGDRRFETVFDGFHECEGYVQPDAPMAVVFNTTVLITSRGTEHEYLSSPSNLESVFSELHSHFGRFAVSDFDETVYRGLLPGDKDMPPEGSALPSGFWEDLFPVTSTVFFSVYFDQAAAASLDTLMPMFVGYVASYAGMQ